MSKVYQKTMGSDVYALLQRAQMSEPDRKAAINALHIAEAFADAVLWVREKISGLGTYFLKPSVKH